MIAGGNHTMNYAQRAESKNPPVFAPGQKTKGVLRLASLAQDDM